MSDDQEMSAFEAAKAKARSSFGGKTLLEMVQAMRDKAAEKERLEAELSEVNAWYDVLRMEIIPEKMDNDGIENTKFAGIGRVSLTADMFVAVKDNDGLQKWMSSHKFKDLIKPTINSSTLKAFLRRRIADGKEIPADFVRITPFTRASITKS